MVTNKNLNNCQLVGRFGNKLFIIAALIGLAKENNDKVLLPEHDDTGNWKFGDVFKNKMSICDYITVGNTYQEPEFKYNKIPYVDNLHINGYFQSYKYFENAINEVKYQFTMKDSMKERILKKYCNELEKTTVSIHVRRGDYVRQPQFHPCCTTEYYIDALQTIGEYDHVFICSDDIPYCKTIFKGDKCIFVEENDHMFDFFLMTMTSHNIIANSSFSWWSAFLNTNYDKNKKVIYPKPWFGTGYSQHDTSLLCPETWQEIRC